MHDDPLRAQSMSLAVGAVLATLAAVAEVVVAVVAPRGVPDAPIVMARESGALYVRVGRALHPVPNLASARLVARAALDPVPAAQVAIDRGERGPMIGIPGAPATLGTPLRGSVWTVCDDDRTVVTVGPGGPDSTGGPGGPVGPGGPDSPGEERPVLLVARGEGPATTYLTFDGRRAAVDLRDRAVVEALRLGHVDPIPVSRTLLDLVPELPAIITPRIAGAGEPGPAALGGATVGSLVQVRRADGTDRYVVRRDGVQRVGEVYADLVGFGRGRPVATVSPAAIAAAPVAGAAEPILPRHAERPVGAADHVAVCARWRPRGRGAETNIVVFATDVPFSAPTDLAQADGDGPLVDAVAIPGGAGVFARAVPIVGDDAATGSRFLVTDAGVVYGVHDDEAATSLGLGPNPEPAPWPILAQLPHGPELSTAAAGVLRDGLASTP